MGGLVIKLRFNVVNMGLCVASWELQQNLHGFTKYPFDLCIDKSPNCLLDALKYSYLMELYDWAMLG